MNRYALIILAFFAVVSSQAQEIRATVVVNAEQTSSSNQQVFKTLEQSVTEFINETRWTNKTYANQERINASFAIVISGHNGDNFNASLQVQASRPVFNSTYQSLIYNYNDRQFNFAYREFESLTFNPNSFDSNLVSTIAFHIYTILGLDASTFSEGGGGEYFDTAKQIVSTAAGSNFQGWKSSDGNQSRYQLNDALISQAFDQFHVAMYQYHRLGLDIMAEQPLTAKKNIADAINSLKQINDTRPNSYLLRVFFDSKAEEIESVFSGGPSVEIAQLVQNLGRMAPTKRQNWSNIKY